MTQNGNQVSSDSDTFTYDHENRLTQAVVGGVTRNYGYNGDGLRTSQTGDAYVWDINSEIPEIIHDGTRTFVHGYELISNRRPNGQQRFYMYDGLGSVTEALDPSGAVRWGFRYDVFGETRSTIGTGGNEWRFTGEWQDGTGLYYLLTRYYDPSTGRFLSRDSLPAPKFFPRSATPYHYAFNNPASLRDPTGRWPCPDLICEDAPKAICDFTGEICEVVEDIISEPWIYISHAAQLADIAPVGTVLGPGTLVGIGFDVLAFGVVQIDIFLSECPADLTWAMSGVNASNLAVGIAGNLGWVFTAGAATSYEIGVYASSAGVVEGCGSVATGTSGNLKEGVFREPGEPPAIP